MLFFPLSWREKEFYYSPSPGEGTFKECYYFPSFSGLRLADATPQMEGMRNRDSFSIELTQETGDPLIIIRLSELHQGSWEIELLRLFFLEERSHFIYFRIGTGPQMLDSK
jgi:hypothetical protein